MTDRLVAERIFHDEQALARAEHFDRHPDHLRFEDAEFLDHETWVRSAFAALGDLRGKAALDYGCGHGMAAVTLARAGAIVSAFDLSPEYVAEAERRAKANGVEIAITAADAVNLPYADESFDAVWGNAILHHLDLDRAAAELHRVLKPGGVAVFCEPWGGNPLLRIARRFLPYPGKHRTVDEQPLTHSGLRIIGKHFPEMTTYGAQFFGMVGRVVKWRVVRWTTNRMDRIALALCPPLKYGCRYLVIVLKKR